MSILDTDSGRIEANWRVERAASGPGFEIRAPYRDGLPGTAVLGNFSYRPHAELVARAPAMAEALEAIASCSSSHPDDVVAVARKALGI